MQNVNLANRETNQQDRRFFSRKLFSLVASSDFTVGFFDENGLFPAQQGNIQKANTIGNGSFVLEGIGFGCYVSTGSGLTDSIKSVVTLAEGTAYNSLLQNAILRIQESNKLIYEIPLMDILSPIVSVTSGATPLQDTNIARPEQFFNKVRLNVPYFMRQEQTFSFQLIGRNLTSNTGNFILYAEMLGRFQFASGYGAN